MNKKLKYLGIIILFFFVTFFLYQPNDNQELIIKHHFFVDHVEKPLDDDNDYEIFSTQNGIKSLLVSVSET